MQKKMSAHEKRAQAREEERNRLEAVFDSKRPLTQEQMAYLKPGDWIQVKWIDQEDDSTVLVISVDRRPRKKTVEYIRVFDKAASFNRETYSVELDQVVAILDEVKPPKPKFLPRLVASNDEIASSSKN